METSKADIEFCIENVKNFAAMLAVLGVILSQWLTFEITGNFKPSIELIAAIFFLFIPGYLIFREVAQKVTWLHIVKLAIAQKLEIENIQSFTAQRNLSDNEAVIYPSSNVVQLKLERRLLKKRASL